jgi:uncharacterized protein (DUF1697 family)
MGLQSPRASYSQDIHLLSGGINVGGRALLPMNELRTLCEKSGLQAD